jgi:hypothetical protein
MNLQIFYSEKMRWWFPAALKPESNWCGSFKESTIRIGEQINGMLGNHWTSKLDSQKHSQFLDREDSHHVGELNKQWWGTKCKSLKWYRWLRNWTSTGKHKWPQIAIERDSAKDILQNIYNSTKWNEIIKRLNSWNKRK